MTTEARTGHRPGTVRAGVLGGLCAAFVLLYLVAVRTEAGQQQDAGSFGAVIGLRNLIDPLPDVLRSTMPLLLLGAALVTASLAVASRAWRRLAAGILVAVVPSVLAQVLMHGVLGRPDLGDYGYPENTFPSGHVAAAAGLCAAVVLLWPGGASRSVVAGWSVVAVLAAAVNVLSFAHRPSDVIGSLLLVGAATLAVSWLMRVRAAPVVGPRWSFPHASAR